MSRQEWWHWITLPNNQQQTTTTDTVKPASVRSVSLVIPAQVAGLWGGTCFTTLQIGTVNGVVFREMWWTNSSHIPTWNASVFPQSTDTGQTRWDFFCLFLGNTKSKCGTCCWRTPEERDNKSLIVYFLHLTALSVINNNEKMKGVKATKLTKLVRGRRWWNTPW